MTNTCYCGDELVRSVSHRVSWIENWDIDSFHWYALIPVGDFVLQLQNLGNLGRAYEILRLALHWRTHSTFVFS